MLLITVAAAMGGSARAAAEQAGDKLESEKIVQASTDPERFLPGVVSAQAGSALMAGSGWGGYDGATHTPLLGGTVEARLSRWLILGVSLVYASGNDLQPAAVRPSVAARAQILDQARYGVDAGVGFAFRQDRFVGEDGFFQGALTVGRDGQTGILLANLAFGTDGEGDDREAELRLVAMRRLTARFQLGLDGKLRRSVASSDPHRAERGTPSLEFTAGPALTYAVGPIALMVETGISGARLARLQTGLIALAGMGAVF